MDKSGFQLQYPSKLKSNTMKMRKKRKYTKIWTD